MLDYDDLLLFWSEMMGESGLAAEVGAAFDRVLVDEYQDTNQLQSAIMRSLKSEGTGVTVVGDDAQSIYAFRGATVRNILDFAHRFGQPARSVTLEQNNRSTPPILTKFNAVIAAASERHATRVDRAAWRAVAAARDSAGCWTRPARRAGSSIASGTTASPASH